LNLVRSLRCTVVLRCRAAQVDASDILDFEVPPLKNPMD
jgi:hypothetical protein